MCMYKHSRGTTLSLIVRSSCKCKHAVCGTTIHPAHILIENCFWLTYSIWETLSPNISFAISWEGLSRYRVPLWHEMPQGPSSVCQTKVVLKVSLQKPIPSLLQFQTQNSVLKLLEKKHTHRRLFTSLGTPWSLTGR
jgi:hypothetical protein